MHIFLLDRLSPPLSLWALISPSREWGREVHSLQDPFCLWRLRFQPECPAGNFCTAARGALCLWPCWACIGVAGHIAAGELQEARFLLLFSCASSSLKKAVLEIARQSWDWTSVRAACRHQEYLFSLFALSLGRLCGFLHTVLIKPWPASVQCP